MSVLTARAAADYNPIAGFYNRYWSNHYHPWALAVLDRLLLRRLPRAACILDVCCGNGVLARELSRRGYRVVGIDASEQMLRYARENAPGACFALADARAFELNTAFDAAISTFDSLNHILSSEELGQVFQNVRRALVCRGQFLFDVNLEERYQTAWKDTGATVSDQHACFIRGSYDAETKLGRTEITLFEQSESWRRFDITLFQRFHPAEEIIRLLRRSGFRMVRVHNPIDDLAVEGHFGEGRAVFVATA